MSQVLDMSVIDELLALSGDGDPELLLDLIGIFLDDGPAKVGAIVQGLEEKDFEKMERAAHSLKGSAGNLGALMLQQTCERMQVATRAHSFDESRQLTSDLKTHYGQAQAALEELQRRYSHHH